MLVRIGALCAALVLTAATFSTSAEAQFRGGGMRGGGFGGGGARMGGFGGGMRMGGFGGAGMRMGGFGGARIGNFGGARMGGAFVGGPRMGGARFVGGRYGIRTAALGSGIARNGIYGGRWAGRGGYYRHRWYGYRPYWGLGVGALALAASYPYYGGYGYDSCYVTRRVWTSYGWTLQQVYVCDYGEGYGYW